MSTETEDKANFIRRYESAFSDAAQNLGAPKKGNVWLFRAEHNWQPDGTESPQRQHYNQNFMGRWYGPDIAGTFEHFDRYKKADIVGENIRISALEVPENVAVACYMANIDPSRRQPGADFTPLQEARYEYGPANPDAAFCFPAKIAAGDASQIALARTVNRFLGDLDKHKKTLIEIPMADYERITPEEWQAIGGKVDNQRGSSATVADLKLHAIKNASTQQR